MMNLKERIKNIIKTIDFNVKVEFSDYNNAYVLVKGTITVANTATQGQANNSVNK